MLGGDARVGQVVTDAAAVCHLKFVEHFPYAVNLPGDARHFEPILRGRYDPRQQDPALDGFDGHVPEKVAALIEQLILDPETNPRVVHGGADGAFLCDRDTGRCGPAKDHAGATRQQKHCSNNKSDPCVMTLLRHSLGLQPGLSLVSGSYHTVAVRCNPNEVLFGPGVSHVDRQAPRRREHHVEAHIEVHEAGTRGDE